MTRISTAEEDVTPNRFSTAAAHFASVCALATLGCSGEDAGSARVWTPETAWRLSETPKFELRGATLEETPVDPAGVFLLPSGQFAVPDGLMNGSQRVLIYDENGHYTSAWGRKGPGPGEFTALDGFVSLFRGDSVVVEDGGANELEIFSKDGVHGRALKLPFRGRFLGLLPNANLIMVSSRGREPNDSNVVALYGEGKEPIRIIGVFPAPPRTHGFSDPYVGPSPTFSAGSQHIYYTNGLDFAVKVYDTAGQHVRTLRRDLPRLPMTSAARDEIIAQLINLYRQRGAAAQATEYEKILRTSARWSDYNIAWGNLREDSEGNVWLEHYRAIYPHVQRVDARPTTWSVFDPQGRFLGEVKVPPRVVVASITDDKVLAIWQDDLDVKHPQVYELIKPGSKSN